MKEEINFANCMTRKCKTCKECEKCFKEKRIDKAKREKNDR